MLRYYRIPFHALLVLIVLIAVLPPPAARAASAIQISPISLDFGSVQVGTTSAPQFIRVTNTGSSSVHITGWLNVSGMEQFPNQGSDGDTCVFSSNFPQYALQPGQTCRFTLFFRPQFVGPQEAIIALVGAPPDTPVITATGVGVAPPTSPLPPGTAPQCFTETGKCIRSLFADYWQAHGGLAINGFPISDEFTEVLEDGKPYTVQYFERVRMEYHPENADPQYQVLLGQFGRQIVAGVPGAPTAGILPKSGPYVYFGPPPTGHNVSTRFIKFWQDNGGLAQFGYPVSEEFTETLEDGHPYLVQYFERARFEYHPESADPAYQVQLGQFGRRILGNR